MEFSSRNTPGNRSPMNHSRRTWSNNGTTFTVESSTYSSPGFSFGLHTGSSGTAAPSRGQRNQGSGFGVIGTLIEAAGSLLAASQQRKAVAQSNRRDSRRHAEADDLAYGDEEQELGRRKGKPVYGKAGARQPDAQERRQRRDERSREQSPARRGGRRPGADGRQRSYQERRPSYRNGRSAYVEDITDSEGYDSYESEEEEPVRASKPRRAFTMNDADVIEELEDTIDHHRQEASKCRRRINNASGANVDVTVLQGLLDKLKVHEQAYRKAEDNLKTMRSGNQSGGRKSQTARTKRPSASRRSTTVMHDDDDFFHDDVNAPYSSNNHPDFDGFPFGRMGGPFAAFSPFFDATFDSGIRSGTTYDTFDPGFERGFPRNPLFDAFFGMPQGNFTFSSTSNAQPQFQRSQTGPPPRAVPIFTPTAPSKPKPPAALLKPEEAKRLFKMYNDRWNALSPSDPNVPYPARGLKSSALVARDSIWAPDVSSPIATWSEEMVMQANAQAFYLGVVGLTPQYTEAPGNGKLAMGYSKAKATPAQVKELVDMLKKEKMRWHSDRLGRRNGGAGQGPNEALQGDERARAVFHAVCELMEVAQGG